MNICNFWKNATIFSKAILVALVLYLGLSVYVLLWARGVFASFVPWDADVKLISYALLSFSLATLTASYHLVLIIFKRRRMADRNLADRIASMQKSAGT